MDYNIKRKKNKKKFRISTKYVAKLLITIIITLIVLIFMKASSEFKTHFYKYVFEKNFSFSTINNIYKKYIGSSLPFKDLVTDTKTVFNEQITYSKKEKYKDGAKLKVADNYLIPVLKGGLVVFVGEKEEYGSTVIIQQNNGIDMWYGNLAVSNVKLYDYVEQGSVLGECNEYLYVLFKKDGNVLNYEDYI